MSVTRHDLLPRWCGEGGTDWPAEATHYIMSSCGMATGGECTCDPDKCRCTLCEKHGRYPPGSRSAKAAAAAKAAAKKKANGGSCCSDKGNGGEGEDEGEGEANVGSPKQAEYEVRDPGCAMAWGGKCSCDPATCRCPNCTEHRRKGTGSTEAKEEEAKEEE